MPWLRLSCRASGKNAGALGERLQAAGALAVTLLDAGDAPVLEPPPGAASQPEAWSEAQVSALFALDANLDAARKALAGAPAEVEFVKEQDWSETWRRFAPTRRFGRLVIAPVHGPTPEAGVVMRLDPGLAFGTGAHPTTQLCLDWLARRSLLGKSVLDYGCGSGVLGIAARLLGAGRVVAVDEDPQALAATAANAVRNRASVVVASAEAFFPAPFAVVLANILADALVDLAPRLAGCMAAGGEIALCGILDSQAPRVSAAYAQQGLKLQQRGEREGWALLCGRR